MRQKFPELASFMGGWFHHDFHIHGDTLEEVVAAFKAETDGSPRLDESFGTGRRLATCQ